MDSNFEQKTLANINIVRQISNQLGGGWQKSFGQNFLINQNSLLKFIKSIDLTAEDIVIEIGPGIGVVSYSLCQTAKKVFLIELDINKKPALEKVLENYTNYEVIWADATRFNYEELANKIKNEFPELDLSKNLKVIGSLPYNASKKIIYNFFNSNFEWNQASFFLQKEVAESYASKVPTAEFLGIFAQIYADINLEFMVDPKHFIPIPKVKTWVINFKKIDKFKDINKANFAKFIKTGFTQPRKTVLNNLKGLNYSLSDIQNLGLKDSIRPSEVSVDNWLKLFNLKKFNNE